MRPEFSEAIKKRLALRAAHRCSNPGCRALTVEPHSDGVRAVILGEAAHICGKRPGAARYDTNQSDEDRGGQANGIWLCLRCHKRVDADWRARTVEELQKWKTEHDSWVARSDFVPGLPKLDVATIRGGLLIPEAGSFRIESTDVDRFRDHIITISATSRHELRQLRMRLQFPEDLVEDAAMINAPPGVGFEIKPDRPQWAAFAHGGGSVTMIGPRSPTNLYQIALEQLLPDRPTKIRIRSTPIENPLWLPEERGNGAANLCSHYFQGSFLYEDGGNLFERSFVVPLRVQDGRVVTADPAEEFGERDLVVEERGF